MRDFARRVHGGTRWVMGAHASRHLIHFGTLLVLARWLPPSVFGLFSVLLIVAGAAAAVAEIGLGAALVQRESLRSRDLHTGFWASLAIAAAMFAVVFACAGPVARFFAEPEIAAPLRWYALSFVVGGLGQVPLAMLQRDMDFRRIGVAEIGSQLAFSGVAIALALQGHGLYSFVLARLLGDAASTVALFAFSGYRPRAAVSTDSLGRLVGFGGKIAALRLANHLSANLDRIIIGRVAGSTALGFYAMAFSVIRLPEQHVSQALKRVFFPAFSRLQDDPERLARYYRKLVGYVAFVSFPLSTGVALVYPDFVAAWLGEAWEPTIPLVRILALAGALFSIGGTIGIASWSVGRPGVDLGLAGLRMAVLGPMLAVGGRAGALGVAVAVTLYAVLTFPVYVWVVRRLLGIPARTLLAHLWPALYGCAALAAAVLPVRALLAASGVGAAPALAVTAVVGGAAYAAALLVPRDRLFLEFLAVLRNRGAAQAMA